MLHTLRRILRPILRPVLLASRQMRVRSRDYLRVRRHTDLRRLRRKLLAHLREQNRQWPQSYGNGYFYQGWDRLGITGQRATEVRFHRYGLMDLLKAHMRVLDIGANACMLSCAIAEHVRHVDAVEFNPYQVVIGKDIADHLGVTNIRFINADFMQFECDYTYDLITSFANHHTADGHLVPELRSYLERLHSLLNDHGILLFESHDYDRHDPDFHACMAGIVDLFDLRHREEFSPDAIGNTSPLSGRSHRIYYRLEKRSAGTMG